MILALEAERSPTLNVIKDRFILSVLSICQFCHTNNMLSVVNSINELMLHLIPVINRFELQSGLLVESNTFKGSDKLLH